MAQSLIAVVGRSARQVTCFAAVVLAACTQSGPDTSAIPGDGEDEMIMGGPPWVLPPGDAVAAIPPDIATPLEGLAGTWSGGRLGGVLTTETREKMIELTQLALNQTPAGEKVKWRAGDVAGTITPQMRFAGPGELACREFHQVLRAGSVVETGYATACQALDGSWRLLSE
ncbi:MAG: hypothetical protein AAF337_11335 [Pseudomonadota bacterium]